MLSTSALYQDFPVADRESDIIRSFYLFLSNSNKRKVNLSTSPLDVV